MAMPSPIPQLEFPEKLQCLFSPKRYLVLYGGRGAGRSWGVARFLLLQAMAKHVTVLCARELQKSVSESVHKVLRSQIERIGLTSSFDVQRDYIYGPNNSEFSFIGIKNDPNKVRSYEDIDICWVEEANKVSRDSWKVLLPTIRKKGSRIIMTFNPELKSDYTYKNFVTDLMAKATPTLCQDRESPLYGQVLWHETEDTVICKMDYEDNPWFWSDTELPSDMMKVRDDPEKEDEYLNVWKGFPSENLDGAVYAKELRRARLENRITVVPYEREVLVDTFWDLGFFDQTVVWMAQRVSAQWRVLDCLVARQTELSAIIRALQSREYAFGTHFLPHDGKAKKLGMKHTIQEQLAQAWPRRVSIVPIHRLADGINAVREFFPQLWFNEPKCEEGLEGLRQYRYKVVDGQLTKTPIHDPASDIADGLRTMAMARRMPREGDARVVISKLRRPFVNSFVGGAAQALGWLE